jgi:hypothetical protein
VTSSPADIGRSESGGREDAPARIRTWLAAATVMGLLVATAAAFVITERLKLTPSPILDTLVSKTFSPVCRCATRSAAFSFRLRRGGRVEVAVIHTNGELVRRLARRDFRAGFVFFHWFGRDQRGALSPDGDYQIRVRLLSQHRTIVLPNVIRLNTVPPKVKAFRAERRLTSVGKRLRVSYVLGEVADPILLVDGRVAVVGRFVHSSGTLDWYGKINGRPVRNGLHHLALEARDNAGNISPASASVTVRIRARTLTRSNRHKQAKH